MEEKWKPTESHVHYRLLFDFGWHTSTKCGISVQKQARLHSLPDTMKENYIHVTDLFYKDLKY